MLDAVTTATKYNFVSFYYYCLKYEKKIKEIKVKRGWQIIIFIL